MGSIAGVPSTVVLVVAFYIIFWYVLTYTRFGRYIHQAGNNAEAAKLAGIDADVIRLLSHAILGMLTGFAAVLYVSRMGGAEITVGDTLPIRAKRPALQVACQSRAEGFTSGYSGWCSLHRLPTQWNCLLGYHALGTVCRWSDDCYRLP